MKTLDELYGTRESSVRREAVIMGLICGAISAALVVIAVGLGLDRWRVRNHERLTAEAVAAVAQREEMCRLKLQRFEAVVALADQIDAKRGER